MTTSNGKKLKQTKRVILLIPIVFIKCIEIVNKRAIVHNSENSERENSIYLSHSSGLRVGIVVIEARKFGQLGSNLIGRSVT
ncbi:hypothetical protein WA026_011031 [Henosepilachna vigintioctopunctata]|uniref:Uncharacterized protein n=1 Tax=Henosepilachna vigintioctopunctata TaxID=420089 RepID=A0AAW1U6R7_9CUCU